MTPVLPIDYKFPKETLRVLFARAFPNMQEWVAPEYFRDAWLKSSRSATIEGFLVDHRPDDQVLMGIARDFCAHYGIHEVAMSTQFIYLAPNTVLPWHEDGTPAYSAVNCLLEGNQSSISFEVGDFHYDTALLNIRKKHMVNNGSEGRPMFRIVFHDDTATFENIYSLITSVDNGQRRGS